MKPFSLKETLKEFDERFPPSLDESDIRDLLEAGESLFSSKNKTATEIAMIEREIEYRNSLRGKLKDFISNAVTHALESVRLEDRDTLKSESDYYHERAFGWNSAVEALDKKIKEILEP